MSEFKPVEKYYLAGRLLWLKMQKEREMGGSCDMVGDYGDSIVGIGGDLERANKELLDEWLALREELSKASVSTWTTGELIFLMEAFNYSAVAPIHNNSEKMARLRKLKEKASREWRSIDD